MAASVQLSVGGEFRPSTNDPLYNFAAAVGGDVYATQRVLYQPHFKIRSTTDSNDAASSSNFALDLSAEGLTAAAGALAANQQREIFIDVVAYNGANRYKWSQKQRVSIDGSSNLVLVGPKQFLTDCRATYGMTTADGSATTEVAAECKGPDWFDGAAPVALPISSNTLTISWLGTNSPVGTLIPGSCEYTDAAAAAADARSLQHGAVSLTNGTSAVFISDVATPTAATFANGSAVRAHALLTPPMSVELFVNTTPTPDTLLVCLVGISSDVVTWQVDVTIGDPFTAVLV
jgi:hypothetical protein